MSSREIDPAVYYGSATSGIPGATECPDCGATLRSTSTPDPEEVTSVLDRACPDCDYETVIAVVWFPEQRYLVITDPLATVPCQHDECDADARLISILNTVQVVQRHCLQHVKGHLEAVSADARLL